MRRHLIRIVLLVTVVLLVTGGVYSWQNRKNTLDVVAEFDSAAGLYVGNAVSVLGMPIGEVTRITPRATTVEVAMSLDADVPLPADVEAVTVSTSVLTDRHVELTPPYTGGAVLVDQQVIELSNTRTPVEVDRTLEMADELALGLSGDGEGQGPVADILGAGAAITNDNGDDIRSALTSLSEALTLGEDAGAATRSTVTTVVDNLSELSEAASRNDAAIREFGSAVQQSADLLADQQIGWGTTGAQINEVLREVTGLLERRRGNIAETVTSATTVTDSLVDYRRSLEEFLDVTPLLMDNAYNTINQEQGIARVHAQLDTVFFDSQLLKEVCNVLGLKQLGCATGTLRDFGPDYGMSAMLTGIAGEAP